MSEDWQNIPDELKERDQWLYWNGASDKPRKPLASPAADYGCSWGDPDTWHSFEQVAETAEKVPNAGIGFVNATDNDDFPRGVIGSIDIDGAADDDGHPRDWLPSMQPFFEHDAYVEYSPSNEGLRIPIIGLEAPEWWTDFEDIDGEHKGVEVLTNKFSTYTGNKLRGAGDEPAEYGEWVNEWLREVYKALEGEDPLADDSVDVEDRDDSGPDYQPDDEWLTEEAAEEALAKISPDCGYDTWKDIGMALSNRFGRATGGRLFKQWSRGGSKWDSDAEDQAERIISDASSYNYDAGTIVHHATNHGWDASAAAREYGGGSRPNAPAETKQPESDGDDAGSDWEYVATQYQEDYIDFARKIAADLLESETSFMYVLDTGILWRYDAERGYYIPKGEAYIHRTLEDELGQHYRQSEKSEIIDRIHARNQVDRKQLNAKEFDRKLLCVGNGVVNLSTGDLLDHDPKFKFIRGLEHDYDPDADRSAIVDFLSAITKREEDWQTLVDHLAHGLMPGHPYRAFVMMYGPGGNGKTQFGELLRGFVGGDDNAAAVELQDLCGDDDFATGALPSAFINIGDDVGVSEIRDMSTLKTASGGGTLRANEKHEKKFDFTNEAAMFFSANEPPRIKEGKQSIDDRLYPIEMPYRFVDDPDPEDDYEKQKTPGIADDLLEDDEAMRGLLALAVEHAQRLVETNGEYSMPEGPAGRRDIYEAASDPIRRFAFDFLEGGDAGDQILKDDAYTVYTTLCDRDGERPARDDIFKSEMSQQSILDLESAQTRQLTPGDGRETCWKYVRFDEESKDLMSSRLIERYFPGAEEDGSEESDGSGQDEEEEPDLEQERAAFGAEPIRDAADALTGYVTVTAEIATTQRLGETESGLKAVLKDMSSAIDLVAWDTGIIETLEAHEGECVAIQNAEVTEYDGVHQLSPVDGLTDIQGIQQGVGYTEGAAVEESQAGLDDIDREEWAQTEPKVREELRTATDPVSIPELAGRLEEEPQAIQSAVDTLSEQGVVVCQEDGVELNN